MAVFTALPAAPCTLELHFHCPFHCPFHCRSTAFPLPFHWHSVVLLTALLTAFPLPFRCHSLPFLDLPLPFHCRVTAF